MTANEIRRDLVMQAQDLIERRPADARGGLATEDIERLARLAADDGALSPVEVAFLAALTDGSAVQQIRLAHFDPGSPMLDATALPIAALRKPGEIATTIDRLPSHARLEVVQLLGATNNVSALLDIQRRSPIRSEMAVATLRALVGMGPAALGQLQAKIEGSPDIATARLWLSRLQ
jgi:hypothetical protein